MWTRVEKLLGPALETLLIQASGRLDKAVLRTFSNLHTPLPADRAFPPVDPERFWRQSAVGSPAKVHIAADLGRGHRGRVRVVDLEGPSYGPGAHPGSRKLIARAFLRDDLGAEAPMVLMLHGFAVGRPVYDDWQARLLSARGLHVVRLDLPFHMRRRALGTRSGDGFLTADLARVRDSIRQAVEDSAAIVAWARGEARAVTVFGTSLGGLVGSLLAALVEVEGLVAVAPFCDPPETFIERLPPRLRRRLGLVGEAGGLWGRDPVTARQVLDAALAPVVPRHLVPVTAPGRMTLIVPEFDGIVGAGPIRQLAEVWGTTLWDYRHGHISIMNARGLVSRIHDRLISYSDAGRDQLGVRLAG